MAQEEVLPEFGDASPSHQQVPEREEVFSCKHRRRVDDSLKKTFSTKETSAEASRFEEFSDSVRHWQTEKFISMIDKEPQLLFKTFAWSPQDAQYTVLQLAVVTNSEKLVTELLNIAIREFGRERQQLLNVFKLWEEFEISVLDVARVTGNRCIQDLLNSFKYNHHWSVHFNSKCSPSILEQEEVRLALIRSILNKDVEEAVSEFASPELKELPVEEDLKTWVKVNKGKTVRDSLDRTFWWGRTYGIVLGDRDDLFVLHDMAENCHSIRKEILKWICGALRGKHLARLLEFKDDEGLTPVHRSVRGPEFICVVREYCEPDFNILNVRDISGGTLLHRAAAHGAGYLVRAMTEIDGFKRILDTQDTRRQNFTALHLAVMHNHLDIVKMLVKQGCNINASSGRFTFKQLNAQPFHEIVYRQLTALQMAAIYGRVSIMRTFLEEDQFLDWGMTYRKHQQVPTDDMDELPALHLAAVSGNPLAVKTLLDDGNINPLAIDRHGNTALHYAAGRELFEDDSHLVSLSLCAEAKDKTLKAEDLAALQKQSLGGIIGCMDLLIQAGVDMGKQNNHGETPQLAASASDDLSRWWYDKLARQTQEAKTNLVVAGNAISVTAALVATASYVGPLQPPLGLSISAEEWLKGYSQVNHSAVQAFLFCNSLSFYLAIASIMLATIPSLTIPQEALPLELRVANRVVQGAILLLFASITTVICAFSAASIAVVPESRWHSKSLTVVSIILGGFVCSVALCLFLIRLMRLMKPSSKWVLQLNEAFFPSGKLKKQLHSKTGSKLLFFT